MPTTDKQINIIKPDDWHLHLRDGALLRLVVPWTARAFARAIIMPNLPSPVTDVARCRAYHRRITAAAPPDFEPLMTLYLSEETTPQIVSEAKDSGLVHGIKMYPRHATTHSGFGVRNVEKVLPVFERMQQLDVPLLVHGEYVADDVDIFDREKIFIDKVLAPLRERFSELRIVLEHVTTGDGAAWVGENDRKTAATITPHHLLYSRNALFEGGIRPHRYCLPLPQRETHRAALVAAATGGRACFFAGTDSAPHCRHEKESACGCAGVFNAPAALAVYASVFDQAGKLGRLEQFASLNGAAFYRLEPNQKRITLVREAETIAECIGDGDNAVIPLLAGQKVPWRIQQHTTAD